MSSDSVGRGRRASRQMVIASPDGKRFPPDADTMVPCPACAVGLVSPTLAAKLKTVLPPKEDPEALLVVNTDIIERPELPPADPPDAPKDPKAG